MSQSIQQLSELNNKRMLIIKDLKKHAQFVDGNAMVVDPATAW